MIQFTLHLNSQDLKFGYDLSCLVLPRVGELINIERIDCPEDYASVVAIIHDPATKLQPASISVIAQPVSNTEF